MLLVRKINVSQEEINMEIQKQFRMMPGQEKIVKDYYEQNPAAIDSLRGQIYEEKIIEEIKKKAKTTKKEITKEEAEKILKQENENNIKEQAKLAKKDGDEKNKKKIDPKKEISLYINSPGGLVTAGLGIYDTMQYIKPEISTLCIGQAASMGSFLLAAGAKGKRFSLPNSRIMVHQPSAGFQGQATDIEIHANEVLSLKKRLNEIYSKHTGKSVDEIKSALERDNFMTPDNAKSFGLIDKVVEKRE